MNLPRHLYVSVNVHGNPYVVSSAYNIGVEYVKADLVKELERQLAEARELLALAKPPSEQRADWEARRNDLLKALAGGDTT